MNYRTSLADPPWKYENWSERGVGKGAAGVYDCEGASFLEALPVQAVCKQDAMCLMWATNPMLPDAFRLLTAWGFEFKSLLTWVKMSRLGALQIGCGYQVRGCSEHLLIGARGSVPAPEPANRPCGVIFHPRGAHSAKPDFQYDLAENYPGPYLELFHRPRNGMFPPREGWTFLGNEVDGQDIGDALRGLSGAALAGVR